ncbi:MAG: glycosyltransferase family 2 protein [Rhodospirillaceae bacterium]
MTFSLVIPVYKNASTIPALVEAVKGISNSLRGNFEVVFVVDGSPDASYALLRAALDGLPFAAQLLAHSRNFGSFAAIRTGLSAARGDCFAVMAADLQEPPELMVDFFSALATNEWDVVIGTRSARRDPLLTRLSASAFWGIYRRFVVKEIPPGGVDVFGCNRQFRDQLLNLEESRSSLIALIFWLGFRRKLISYERRQGGASGWTLRKKVDYMLDSFFAFTDYPIRLLIRLGFLGSVVSILLAAIVLAARLMDKIDVPGYAATMLAVLFLGAINLLGLGVVGTYAWRAYENSKSRPLAIVATHTDNGKRLS